MAPDEVQPFIGPQPFSREQRDRFFGRKRETADLASLVIAHPIVFFYGQSGTGKSSLIQAGLVPLLADEEEFEIFPVARPGGRVNLLGAEVTTASPYVYSTLLTWSGGHGSEAPSETNLTEFLAKRIPQLDKYDAPRPRLLIFDQLEELFTDQIDVAQEQQEFFEQIGELLDASRFRITERGDTTSAPLVPTRVLLAMREEYIAELDKFASLLPDRLRVRFRLERLREPAALEAVTGPLGSTALFFAPGVAEKLVSDLREVRVEAGFGEQRTAVNVLGEFVEPVQLQVVCERLVRDIPPGVSEITSEHLSRFGSVDATLAAFYKDAVSFAAASIVVSQDDLERWCESFLITGTGTRAVVHRGPMHSAGMPNAAPDALVSRFLLRLDQRAGAYWYELTHDRLISPIQTAREERKRQEGERREAEQIRRRREAERRTKILASSVAMFAVLGLVIGVWWLRTHEPVCEGTLACVWRFQAGGEVFGRAAVNEPQIYVSSVDGNVYAVDVSRPRQLWAFIEDGASRENRKLFSAAGPIWSSPVIVDGDLYFGSDDHNFYAVNAERGEKQWEFTTGGAVVSSPVIDNGIAYVGSFDCNLYAIDVATRKERWRFPTRDIIVSSPAVVGEVVYFGSNDRNLYALDAETGNQRWRFPAAGIVRSNPAVTAGRVYVGSAGESAVEGYLYALDARTGEPIWTYKTGGEVRSSPIVVDGFVYVGSHDQNLYAIDATTGMKQWEFETGGLVVSSPEVIDGVVYFGSFDGNYYAVDAASGKELGRLTTESVVESFSTLAGNQIIFGARDGTVFAISKVPSASGVAQLSSVVGSPPATPGTLVATGLAPPLSNANEGASSPAAPPPGASSEASRASVGDSCQPDWSGDES